MYPLTKPSSFRAIAIVAAGLLVAPAIAPAQQPPPDAAPVDIGQLLQALRVIKQKQAIDVKAQKISMLGQITAAAGSNERAVAAWEEAIKATQMDGAGREGAQFKAWKESEGEAFKAPQVQNAVRLHFEWLALTLQRSAGTPVKDMMSNIVRYTQELLADAAAIDALDDAIKKEKDPGPKNGNKAQKSRDDIAYKKTHDSILNKNLNNSVVVQWLKLADFITLDKWELRPGDYDGIFKNIILPEMRNQKDQRVFEYWDAKLSKEADNASKTHLKFEIDKFNTQRRPTLLWNRAMEYVNLGLRNRGFTELFGVIKAYPTHPDADDWIAKLESLALPPAPATLPATDGGTAAPAPIPPLPAPGAPAVPGAPSSTAVPVAPGAPTAAAPVPTVPGL